MPTDRFPLAPMSPGIFWLTVVAMLVPVVMVYLASLSGYPAALGPAGLVVAIYLFIWLYLRPTRFELSADTLELVWPVRRYAVPLADVAGVERISSAEFKARFGWAMRVGAGGLWGGFGLLVTKRGSLRFYISRLDGYVLISRRSDRPLLITPDDPETFVRLLDERSSAG